MYLCFSNPFLLDGDYWFLPKLLEQSGQMDKAGNSASLYYIGNFKKQVSMTTKYFKKLWVNECADGVLSLPKIVNSNPAILNANLRCVRSLLGNADQLDEKNNSAFYYAVKDLWITNICGSMLLEIAESAPELQARSDM